MALVGRTYNASNYRYGFNGKEQDKETTSTSTYDYGFRIYSPALGRFLSTDPLFKSYPELTPYQFASNTPIQAIDLDGLEKKDATYKSPEEIRTAKIIKNQSVYIFNAVQASNNTSVSQVYRYCMADINVSNADENRTGSRSNSSQVRGAYGEGVWAYLMNLAMDANGFKIKFDGDVNPKTKKPTITISAEKSNEMSPGEGGYAFQKNGFDVQFTMSFGVDLQKSLKVHSMYVGFNEADGSVDNEFYCIGTKTFGFEVKTYSPSNTQMNIKGFEAEVKKLVSQTIPNNKYQTDGTLVPVLVTDKDAWNNAYKASPTLMQSIYDRLINGGGKLMLQEGLYQGVTDQMQSTKRQVNNNP